jgi:hypothetical protein
VADTNADGGDVVAMQVKAVELSRVPGPVTAQPSNRDPDENEAFNHDGSTITVSAARPNTNKTIHMARN